MASTINADNGILSGISGIIQTGDASGVLALQTVGNTAVTVFANTATLLSNVMTTNGVFWANGASFSSGGSTVSGAVNTLIQQNFGGF